MQVGKSWNHAVSSPTDKKIGMQENFDFWCSIGMAIAHPSEFRKKIYRKSLQKGKKWFFNSCWDSLLWKYFSFFNNSKESLNLKGVVFFIKKINGTHYISTNYLGNSNFLLTIIDLFTTLFHEIRMQEKIGNWCSTTAHIRRSRWPASNCCFGYRP